jgi:hypothetical protein
MTSAEKSQMKKDIQFVSAFYGLSPESERMAYLSAIDSDRARSIYRKIRESIERDGPTDLRRISDGSKCH